jgi:DNA-directed RNA polymerase delta subunit
MAYGAFPALLALFQAHAGISERKLQESVNYFYTEIIFK